MITFIENIKSAKAIRAEELKEEVKELWGALGGVLIKKIGVTWLCVIFILDDSLLIKRLGHRRQRGPN